MEMGRRVLFYSQISRATLDYKGGLLHRKKFPSATTSISSFAMLRRLCSMVPRGLYAGPTLGWKPADERKSLTNFICDCTITEIKAGLLQALCSRLKLKHGKLTHRLRVELFLRQLVEVTKESRKCLNPFPRDQRKPERKLLDRTTDCLRLQVGPIVC